VPTPILNGLGQAIRWLRDRQNKKQYQVADSAGITKGMLSAYETGRQRPSLETLDKILDTLGCYLNDHHNAIQIINGRPEKMKRRGEEAAPEPVAPAEDRGPTDLLRVLGRGGPLPFEEERAFSEMLDGFHRLLRYFHDSYSRGTVRGERPPVSPVSPVRPVPPPEDDEDDKKDR
jgi:transcriptional regulator with XRE-family HTH domain